MVDLLPVLGSVICFISNCSTPIQIISNIYWRILQIGVRAKFILKAMTFTQQFSKLTPPDRNNLITSVFDFPQPRLCFPLTVLQSFLDFSNGFVSIGHAKTPMPKAHEVLKDFIRPFAVPINFHIMYPSQTKFPPITGMKNIVTLPSNVCQPLKSLNRLVIPHKVDTCRDNTYRIWFQKYGSQHVLANGRYFNILPKGVQIY